SREKVRTKPASESRRGAPWCSGVDRDASARTHTANLIMRSEPQLSARADAARRRARQALGLVAILAGCGRVGFDGFDPTGDGGATGGDGSGGGGILNPADPCTSVPRLPT